MYVRASSSHVESHRNIPVLFLCPTSSIYCQLKIPHPQDLIKIVSQVRCSREPHSAHTPCHSASFLIPVSFFQLHHFFADPQSVTRSPSLPSHHPISLPTQDGFPLFQTSSPSTSQRYPHAIYSGFNHGSCLP